MSAKRRSYFRSIRFRLTAWYTILLALIVISVGVSLSKLLAHELRDGVDQRLQQTADTILDQGRARQIFQLGPGVYDLDLPSLNPIASPGQVVQVINLENQVIEQTGGSDGVLLPFDPAKARDRGEDYLTASVDGQEVRTIQKPIIIQRTDIMLGAVIVGESMEPINRTLDLLRRLLFIGSAIGIAFSAAGGWLLAGRALQPVDRITAAAAEIASEDGSMQSLSNRLDIPDSGDELARLAATFNLMLGRLEQAFMAQRRFIADASHELRTPLTAIRGNVDVLLRQATVDELPTREDLIDALNDIHRETGRMRRLLEDLLTLARADAPESGGNRQGDPVSLNLIADEAIHTARAMATGQQLEAKIFDPVVVQADSDQLRQLLLILLENAIRHTPPEGEIMIAVSQEGDRARLTVRDSGEGIAPEHVPHLFERFYRADPARNRARGGTGLGLAIARAIVHAHGGEIIIASTLGKGTTVTVQLPAAERAPVNLEAVNSNRATVGRAHSSANPE